jgi:F-type H+-transporting ATPase subunit delta
VAQRYARALADVAIARKQTEQVKKDLAVFASLVEQSAALRNVLASPAVGREKKLAILSQLAVQAGAGPAVRNFVMILTENRRTQLLPQIREAYEQQLNARLGIAEAEVTSARELTADEKTRISAALGKMTGKRVEAHYRLDAALLGGAVARIGSTIYNGSVRDQLRRLQEKLAAE